VENYEIITASWFKFLRDTICQEFENIELEFMNNTNALENQKFHAKKWYRPGGGGGEMSIMHGKVFEKVGVNISTVYGTLDEKIRHQIPGTENSSNFFATGISIVAHPFSPLVPAAHFNTRYLQTNKHWFGGGADMTPVYPDASETAFFHQSLKKVCDEYNTEAYEIYSKACDEYFYLPHRKESRGVGGIFYDYLNSDNFSADFTFTKNVGIAFAKSYKEIVLNKMHLPWQEQQKTDQLIKRGRYIEFNLLYDRGTKFGLMTDGNVEAIFMSLPPLASWI